MIRTPLIPLHPNHKTQFLYLALLLLTYVSAFLILIPSHPYGVYYGGVLIGLMVGIIVPLVMATVADAGKIKPDKDLDFLELL